MTLTLDDVRREGALFFECVSGSKAYGTDTRESDTDLRGVFVAPQKVWYGLEQVDQVSDARNDETYYELGRFVQLLAKNNPNCLEMLCSAEDCVRFRHPLWERLAPGTFLSKLCESTFAGYAMTQVRKARGLNKKIVNPMAKERKGPIDFCYVLEGQGSIPLREWLERNSFAMEQCGLVNIPHMHDVYGIYHDSEGVMDYRGIFKDDEATEVRFSSVSVDAVPAGWMTYNRDAFKKYCEEHKEYWEWRENRNEARYETNVSHGRNYDSKNMMHTFRLLDMAAEIAEHRRITVRSPNRSFLMKVRAGDFEYDDLIAMAEERIASIADLYVKSDLPEEPNWPAVERILVEIRTLFYDDSGSRRT